jgi:hypothetical protein
MIQWPPLKLEREHPCSPMPAGSLCSTFIYWLSPAGHTDSLAEIKYRLWGTRLPIVTQTSLSIHVKVNVV